MRNSGDTESDSQSVQVDTPDGVSLSGGSGQVSSNAPALRRFSAFLAPAAADGGAGGDGDFVQCGDSQCRYTVPANSMLEVTLQLTVTPVAADGDVTLTLPGSRPISLPVTVAPGLTALNFSTPSGGWHAGTTVTTSLHATVADNVTDAGPIRLSLHQKDFWITSYPSDRCTAVPGWSTTVECAVTITPGESTARLGSFDVTLLPQAEGNQTLSADLPGDRSIPINDPDAAPLKVRALAPGDAIAITGQFGGSIVGASTMECSVPSVTRADCQSGDSSQTNPGLCEGNNTLGPEIHDGDDHDGHSGGHGQGNGSGYRNHGKSDDDKSSGGDHPRCLIDKSHPQSFIVPDGATILSATLTWVATAPADGNPESLDTVTFHYIGSGATTCNDSCSHEIGPESVTTPVPDTDDQMYVRAADVTKWVTGSGRVWASDIAATRKNAGTTPMAGWALSVVWTTPGSATSTVTLTNPGTYSLSGDPEHSDRVQLAQAGDAISTLDTVVWAADPWADKHFTAGGDPIEPTPITGTRTEDDPDNPGQQREIATGVNVLTGMAAPSNSAVIFTNQPKREEGPWGTESYQDGLWIGPTLVIRDAG